MKRILKFGCLTIVGFLVIVTVTAMIFGDNPQNETKTAIKENKNEVIIDVNQFSRLSPDELVEIMGKPESVEDFQWEIPKSGESIVGKLYTYENNKFEFLIMDNTVVRLNIYSASWLQDGEELFSFENEETIFSMFGITPSQNLKKIVDNNFTLRYSPVSDKVADVWILEIKDNKFGLAKITYNLKYF